MVLPLAAAAVPYVLPLAAAAATTAAYVYSGAAETVGQAVRTGLADIGDYLRETLAVGQQQAANSQIMAAQSTYTEAMRAQDEALWHQWELQAQANAAELQAQATQNAALATTLDGVVSTATSEAELYARAWQVAQATKAEFAAQQAAVNSAAQAWEATQAEAAAVTEAAAAAETAAIAEAAGMAGAAVPGLGTAATAGALSAAGLAALIPTMANSFANSSHKAGLGCMTTTGAALLQGVMQTALPAAAATLFMVSPALQELIGGFAEKAVSLFAAPMERQAPITPEKAPGIGAYLLSQAVLMGTGAHLASVTAEASAPLKHMGLGYLAAFMADMAGFSRIAAAFQGQMINWGLMQPMRYYSLEKFRPMIPDPRLLMEMSLKREITDAQFKEGMGYAGYSNDWIETFNRYKWRDPRLFEVLWIADVTKPDPTPPPEAVEWLTRAGMTEWIGPDWWYAIKFAKGGYDPIDLPVLAKVTKRRTMATARTRRLFSTRQLYREGYVDEDYIREQFQEMDEPEEAANHWIIAERQERVYYLSQDMKSLYLAQFTKGIIDEDDLKVALSTLIVDPEFLSLTMQKAVTSVTPKVAAVEPPENKAAMREAQSKYIQAYTQLYRKDQIDESTFYDYLVELKVTPGVAEATVTLEAYKKLPKV